MRKRRNIKKSLKMSIKMKRIIRSRWAKINFRESGPEKIAEEEIDIPEISHTDQFESENIAETQEDVLATDNKSEIGQTEMKEPELTHETSEITGRRFFDVLHFWSCVQKFKHYPSFECGMEHVTLQEEKRYGLQSTFIAVCELCGVRNIIETESRENAMNVNVAAVLGNISVRRKSRGFKYPCDAVLGNISVGAGFPQLEESLAVLNIPALPYRIYASEEEKLGAIIHKTAWKNMEEAGKEEAEIAKQLGNIDEHGYPFITVIADGAWCKRTYRVNYNSLSGVGCIIREATGKLLFLGIRNKYCSMCECAKSKGKTPSNHMCFRNWTGPSTAMESDIIVEGFQRSIEMHGIKYYRLVGDGDSSVMKKLREAKPYGVTTVEKIECTNHLLRNYCNKLKDLVKSSRSSTHKLVPIFYRKKLENNIIRMRTAIKEAAQKRREEPIQYNEKIQLLTKDILNSPNHVFGRHNDCEKYFCTGRKEGEEDLVQKMVECGLFQDIMKHVYRIVKEASSFLRNMTNNAAEQYNSIVCKFIGGKRINYSLKGSYKMRCEAAAISFNCKEEFVNKVYETATQGKTNIHTLKFIRKRKLKRLANERRRLQGKKKLKMKQICHPDSDYGNVESEDILPADYDERKTEFLNNLRKKSENIFKIEEETRLQSANPKWIEERSFRLTASKFGEVYKRRESTQPGKLVRRILYNDFKGSSATDYGNANEAVAKHEFENITGLNVQDCGIFIGRDDIFFLGASPDGIIEEEDAIIEIKCPKNLEKISIEEGVKTKKIDCLSMDPEKNNISLKKKHNYMYQIQGQLNICQRKKCYFILWSPLGIHIEEIKRDEHFWTTQMKPKLTNFYMKHMLPEIIHSKIK